MRITSTSLIGGGECQFGDFNVFIGGNGVGKTTFILELYSYSAGIPRQRFRWIDTPVFHSESILADMELLSHSLSRRYDGSALYYFSHAARDVNGNVDLDNALRFSEKEVAGLKTPQETDPFRKAKYRRPFVSLSSCDARLGLPDAVEIGGLNQPPQDPLNVLYRYRDLRDAVDRTIQERFQFHFVLLDHNRRQLQLGVSKTSPPAFNHSAKDAQGEFERVEQWRERHFAPLSESGHGIRSMIRLLTSLFEPVNKVILIDEPEIHLYPAQKRWLGKQLVELAKDRNKQVFLVTHDPIILQGVLDANTSTNVFRVERTADNSAVITSCEFAQFTDVPAIRNQEQYLQGLFYRRCIVVEGAADRSFYQNMIDDYPAVHDKDLGFVVCGGLASAKHMAALAAKVKLTCSFILDLDALLFQPMVLKSIYETLGGVNNPLKELEDVFADDHAYATAKDDKQRNAALKRLTGYTDRNGFSQDWKASHAEILQLIDNRLKGVGLFLVPGGSLESWAPEVAYKQRFAEAAPDVIRADAALSSALKSFLDRVLAHVGAVVTDGRIQDA